MYIVTLCMFAVIAAGVSGTEYHNCKAHLDSVEPMPGAYSPSCNEAGNYEVKQCHTSARTCWCVDQITGEEIENTRLHIEEPICPVGTACQQLVANTESMPGAYVPQCTDDGKYERKQCHSSTGYCWCAHPETNAEEENTRKSVRNGETVECPEIEEESKTACQQDVEEVESKGMLVGAYKPQCDDDGMYTPLQCHGSTGHCWCVDPESNEEIEGTRLGPGMGRPECDEELLGEGEPDAWGSASKLAITGFWLLCLLCALW